MVYHTLHMSTRNSSIDPQIRVADALEKVGGNQAELARQLGIERASVNGWVRTGMTYLPPLQAHRYVKLFGESHENEAAA